MKTVIVGGGKGSRAIMELLAAGHLRELSMDVVCVVDPQPDAPGMIYARERGIETAGDYREAILRSGCELILELTGDADILDRIYHELPRGVRVIDHGSARIFWDLINLEDSLRDELRNRAVLEERLAEEMARAQHVLDSLPDIVIVLDPEKRIRQTNARFSAVFGIPTEDVIGRPCGEIFCGGRRSLVPGEDTCPFAEAVATGKPVSRVVERRAPGEGFYEITACPQFDAAGELIEVVETQHPVTERILLQREIEMSELRFRQFINSAQDVISIKDRDGRYVVVNPASAGLFGLQPHEILGKTADEIYDTAVAEMVRAHDTEVMELGHYQSFLETYRRGDRPRFLQTTRFPIFDYEGRVDGVGTIARDVTQERELQGQVVQNAKLAAVGKLAAGVAHEINNPLTGVLAFAEDLHDDIDPDDPRREDCKVIIRESLRCRDIVRNLLDFARQEEPTFEIVDLNSVIQKTLRLVEKLPGFHDTEVIRDLCPDTLPVRADARQLQQVLLNFIINANDAMSHRGSITLTSEHAGDRGCRLSVTDTGPGVAREMRDRIFEPFYSTKKTSGLGLAVSWGIIERHGGSIDIDEAEGGGAVFAITLPLADTA